MQRSPKYQWQLAFNTVRMESDPDKLLPLLADAVVSLERRAAEWNIEPGTKAELWAVLHSIATLRKRLAWYLEQ